MKVYRVELEQTAGSGYLQLEERYDIQARTAQQAIQKAVTLAKASGALKSRPIVIKSLTETVSDLR